MGFWFMLVVILSEQQVLARILVPKPKKKSFLVDSHRICSSFKCVRTDSIKLCH